MRRGMKLAALTALAFTATPGVAFDGLTPQQAPGMKFYISVPFDVQGIGTKKQTLGYGLQLQGQRAYESINIDNRLMNGFLAGGLEAKLLIGGLVAAGAVAAVASKDKDTTASYEAAKTEAKKKKAASGDTDCPEL
ncbi:MAG TPA: hypothetical protein VJQ58_12520, partial [Burkholderiales bacterium]|nr:hypothetical protein [Burkholderiales bacterium]